MRISANAGGESDADFDGTSGCAGGRSFTKKPDSVKTARCSECGDSGKKLRRNAVGDI